MGAAQEVTGWGGELGGGALAIPGSEKLSKSPLLSTHTQNTPVLKEKHLVLRDSTSIVEEEESFLDYSVVCLPAPGPQWALCDSVRQRQL